MLYKYTRRSIFIKSKAKLLFIILLIITLILIFHSNKESKNKYIAVYLDNIESTSIPDRNSNYIIDKIICDNDAIGTWDNVNWSLLVTNLSKRSNCKTYFQSKKDITITYDNNYIKNNIFEEYYNTDNDKMGRLNQKYINFTWNTKKVENLPYLIATASLKEEYNELPANYGVYFDYYKQLSIGKTYNISFEIKGNDDNFNILIGSEQNGEFISNIKKNWQKYRYQFIAQDTNYHSFIFYNWAAISKPRTIEVRNLSLQEGEYDNFSTTILKEYDNLNNTLPTPTRENYTFLGWYTEPIEGEKISSETIVTEDTTYYAHWQYNESE